MTNLQEDVFPKTVELIRDSCWEKVAWLEIMYVTGYKDMGTDEITEEEEGN